MEEIKMDQIPILKVEGESQRIPHYGCARRYARRNFLFVLSKIICKLDRALEMAIDEKPASRAFKLHVNGKPAICVVLETHR